MGKNEIGRVEEVKVPIQSCVRTESKFQSIWAIKIPQRYKFKHFLAKCSNSSEKLWIETLNEDIKLVVMGNLELKVEKTPKRTIFPDIFGLTEVNQKERKESLLTLKFPKSGKFLIATVMEEMKFVIADKDDFECRGKSNVSAYFGFFGQSRF